MEMSANVLKVQRFNEYVLRNFRYVCGTTYHIDANGVNQCIENSEL